MSERITRGPDLQGRSGVTKVLQSEIHGRGLFSTFHGFPAGQAVCVTHSVEENRRGDLYVWRTWQGAHLNHADEPNCEYLRVNDSWLLVTLCAIGPGQELTVRYGTFAPIPSESGRPKIWTLLGFEVDPDFELFRREQPWLTS